MPNGDSTVDRNRRALANSEERRAKVVRMYLSGMTMRAVARELGLAPNTVIADVRRAREDWKVISAATYDEVLPVKLAQLDQVWQAAWEGWRRSLSDEESFSRERGSGPEGPTSKTKKSRKGQSGNPAFLAQMERCLRLECELRGLLDKDQNASPEGNQPQVVAVVIESREQAKEFNKTMTFDALKAAKKTEGE